MKQFCECNSFNCSKFIELSTEEALKIKETPKAVIIVDGCTRGPEPNDRLSEKKEGYSIYLET